MARRSRAYQYLAYVDQCAIGQSRFLFRDRQQSARLNLERQCFIGGRRSAAGRAVYQHFSPAKAAPGSILNISGFNFSPVAASNVVYFGACANVLTASATNFDGDCAGGGDLAPPA